MVTSACAGCVSYGRGDRLPVVLGQLDRQQAILKALDSKISANPTPLPGR